MNGEVIGINTAIATTSGFIGPGHRFGNIPINQAKPSSKS